MSEEGLRFDSGDGARLLAEAAHIEGEGVPDDGRDVAERPPHREDLGFGECPPHCAGRMGEELIDVDRAIVGHRWPPRSRESGRRAARRGRHATRHSAWATCEASVGGGAQRRSWPLATSVRDRTPYVRPQKQPWHT
ncbi:Uncharacterised protein [Mycobacteroides abscessus subsp. abscessus]|nr:Uncharacterised protein [Mycobacteroides abscessus subsp. abscessus]